MLGPRAGQQLTPTEWPGKPSVADSSAVLTCDVDEPRRPINSDNVGATPSRGQSGAKKAAASISTIEISTIEQASETRRSMRLRISRKMASVVQVGEGAKVKALGLHNPAAAPAIMQPRRVCAIWTAPPPACRDAVNLARTASNAT